MLLAVPFIEIGGKQKITMASICDKKEILQNFSLIIKTYQRLPKIACCEVKHTGNFSFSHSTNLLHPGFLGVQGDTWPADATAFSCPTHFLREKPQGQGLYMYHKAGELQHPTMAHVRLML